MIRTQGLYHDIPDLVAQRIIQEGRYFDERVALRLSPERMTHVRRVAKLAVSLAKVHGVNPADAYVAAILHDIAREIKPAEGRRFLDQVGIPHHMMLSAVVHAEHGAYLAEHEFGVTKPSILNAIRYHTYGHAHMDTLAKIIYCADKCESGRGSYTRPLRVLCRQNLDQGLLATLKADVAHWSKQGSVDPHHPVLQLIQQLSKESEWNPS
jgi:predicted HD superfamily hydrolase involved in NAD metabolism